MELDEFEQLEKDTDVDTSLANTDLETLNVNVWFNKLESRLQHSLIKDNMEEGFLQYQMLVSHAEIIGLASGKLEEEEYEENLIKVDEKIKEQYPTDRKSQNMAYAMQKYKLILKPLLSKGMSNLTLNY